MEEEHQHCIVGREDVNEDDTHYGIEVVDEGSAIDAELLKLEKSRIVKGILITNLII